MSPWDKYRPTWQPLDSEGSYGVNRAGDRYCHDELILADGDLRSDVVTEVVTHGLLRQAVVLNALMRTNRGVWASFLPESHRSLLRRLVRGVLYRSVTHV